MRNWVRLGILALPASGLLVLLSSFAPGVFINPSVDPEGFAQASVSTSFLVGNLLGVAALLLLPVGLLALHSFLMGTKSENLVLAGLMLTFAGGGLFLLFIGILIFAAPVAGRLYLSGDRNAVSVIADSTAVSSLPAFVVGGLSILLAVIGSGLLGIAIWRSHRLPKWSGIPYMVSLPLLLVPYNFGAALLGGLLLLTSGGWMATSIAKWKTAS